MECTIGPVGIFWGGGQGRRGSRGRLLKIVLRPGGRLIGLLFRLRCVKLGAHLVKEALRALGECLAEFPLAH